MDTHISTSSNQSSSLLAKAGQGDAIADPPTPAGVFAEEKGLAAPRATLLHQERASATHSLVVCPSPAGLPPPTLIFGQYACVSTNTWDKDKPSCL